MEDKVKVRFIILGILILLTIVTFYVQGNFTNDPMVDCIADGGVWSEEAWECNYARNS